MLSLVLPLRTCLQHAPHALTLTLTGPDAGQLCGLLRGVLERRFMRRVHLGLCGYEVSVRVMVMVSVMIMVSFSVMVRVKITETVSVRVRARVRVRACAACLKDTSCAAFTWDSADAR